MYDYYYCLMHIQLAYVEGHRLIQLANETFGFNGWSHSVTHQSIGTHITCIYMHVHVSGMNSDKYMIY